MSRHGNSEWLAPLGTGLLKKIGFDFNGPLTLKYGHRLLYLSRLGHKKGTSDVYPQAADSLRRR